MINSLKQSLKIAEDWTFPNAQLNNANIDGQGRWKKKANLILTVSLAICNLPSVGKSRPYCRPYTETSITR